MDKVSPGEPPAALPFAGRRGLALIALLSGLVLAAGAAAAREAPVATPTPGGVYYTPPEGQNITGVWRVQRYDAKIAPVGGGELPFTPAGLTQYQKNMAGLKDGTLKDEARRICVPDGIPRILGSPYPFQIVQTLGQVTIMYELNHVIRPLYLGDALPSAEDLEIFPHYIGYSTAKWEDGTLAIESAGFHGDTYIDATGVPHSEQLRTVERMRRVDDSTLETVVTVTDPAIFTQPWEARFEYKLQPGERIRDYNCGQSFRDISDVPGVTEARRARGP
jgi:hypothetical protein